MPCTHSSSTEMQIGAGEVVVELRAGAGAVAGEDLPRRRRRARRWSRRGARGGPARASSRRRRGPRRAARRARQDRRWTPCHPHISMSSATFTRPSRGDVLELTIDSLAHGGNGVARLEGYVVFVAGGVPGDRVTRRRRQGQEGLRGGARDRDRRALARPRPRVRRPSGRAVAGAALRAPARGQGRAGRGRAAPDRPARRTSRSSRSSPPIEQWRYRNKVEFSFGTGAEGELVCGFHAPGRWNDIVADGRLQARLRARQRAARAGRWRSAASRAYGAVGPARPARLPAQPRRSARAAAPARRRSAWSPRPASSTSTRLIAAVDADGLWWTQTADLGESTYGGETTLLAGAPQLTERLGDLDFLISPEAFFQTNTEMAEKLYGVAIEYAGLRGTREGLRPLLRHRHDRRSRWPPAPAR